MHHSKLVAHLNHRWRTGRPSADLDSTGVIVHIPDGLGLRREGFVGNASRGGLPPPASALWANLGHANRQLPWGDRMSASVVSRKYPRYYIPANIKVASESASHCADHAGLSLRVLKPVHSFLVRRRAARSGTLELSCGAATMAASMLKSPSA